MPSPAVQHIATGTLKALNAGAAFVCHGAGSSFLSPLIADWVTMTPRAARMVISPNMNLRMVFSFALMVSTQSAFALDQQ